jgi:hypothetical protein
MSAMPDEDPSPEPVFVDGTARSWDGMRPLSRVDPDERRSVRDPADGTGNSTVV